MQDDTTTQMIALEPSAYVTLLTVQREVGITRGTLKKYLAYLGIEPVCFHIGTRSLYISREAMTLVKHLKENPALLAHLPSRVLRPQREEGKTMDIDMGKETTNGL